MDLDAGTPPAFFPQGWKGGVVLQLGVKLLSPCQDFGTRDPNPALQGPFVALPLSQKGIPPPPPPPKHELQRIKPLLYPFQTELGTDIPGEAFLAL